MKRLLDAFKLIGYGLLLLIDEAITVLSMWSVGHTLPEKIGLASFGFIIVLLGAWVFLSGIRAKGAERWVKLGAWVLSVCLIVAINWAFTRTMIRTQSSTVSTEQADTGFDERIRQTQIDGYLKQIEALTKKLDLVNVWREADRKAIAEDIDKANAAIKDLSIKPLTYKTQDVSSLNVFQKMSAPVGGNQDLIADLWWILVFLVAQLFTVLAAPKNDDETKPARKPREPKTIDWNRLIAEWVSANWMSVRNPSLDPPYSILPRAVFDQYILSHYKAFSAKQYKAILLAAESTGCIWGETIMIEDENDVKKKIAEGLTNKSE
jgi:hypothetical protein